MKTTYLDNEIILLEGYLKEGTISHYQNRKLTEYREIKKQLSINAVMQAKPEKVCDPVYGWNNNRCINCGAKAGHKCELKNL